MNGSYECESLINNVAWTDSISLLVLAILLLINVMVVVGNCLVIAAVYISSKLRTVTNLFIVSLAVADLMLGLAVLPFSATWEVFKVWIFGDVWCSIWLAVDVWMCTASILNLCAISLDRYVAVTRPVNYPSIMSSTRAKILIAGVWILSFVICFPPLVGWKDPKIANETHELIYGIRVRGTHTVIEDAKPDNETSDRWTNSTDYEDVVSYQTNYSEHFLVRSVGGFAPEEHFKIRHEKRRKERGRTLQKRSLGGVMSFSGVPVVSDDVYQVRIPETRSEEPTTPTTPSPYVPYDCPWTCELTSDPGYVIYSALGSFFIPMTVMLFFYWKIYRAAVQTTRAINQGFRTTKGTGAFGNRFDEQRLTLRIHRGRGSVQNHNSTCSSNTTSTYEGNCSVSASPSSNSTFGKSPEAQRLSRTRSIKDHSKSHEKIKISVSYPSSDQISSSVVSNNGNVGTPDSSRRSNSSIVDSSPGTPETKAYLTANSALRRSSLAASPKKTTFSTSPPRKSFLHNHFTSKRYGSCPKEVVYSVHYSSKNDSTTTSLCKSRDPNCYLRVTGARLAASRSGHRSLSIDSTNSSHDEDNLSRRNSMRSQLEEGIGKDLSPSPTFDDTSTQKPKLIPKMGKRNIKAQVKRFKMETKAAKTLGIIVGGFILCWMPFFTIYLIRAFCPDCINPTVFSVLFWLGYCNSAINPCIYALFSNDFRFAFKKIICRCLCGTEKQTTLHLKRRGSDGSQLKNAGHDRQRSPSYVPPNSIGEDSDPGGSESR